VYCSVKGHQKEHVTHYYPVLLCPHNYDVTGSDHGNVDVFDLLQGGSSYYGENINKIIAVRNPTQWDKMKMETGLTKPPLILRLHPTHSLSVPLCITSNIMHLAG
ncbi:hypothetical protein PAXRUDRAFT_72821, partial [Paxillus rubicundulus Ve08.2h10]